MPDLNDYLTPEEIADTRRPGGPTLNLTAKVQKIIDDLIQETWSIEPQRPESPSSSDSVDMSHESSRRR